MVYWDCKQWLQPMLIATLKKHHLWNPVASPSGTMKQTMACVEWVVFSRFLLENVLKWELQSAWWCVCCRNRDGHGSDILVSDILKTYMGQCGLSWDTIYFIYCTCRFFGFLFIFLLFTVALALNFENFGAVLRYGISV